MLKLTSGLNQPAVGTEALQEVKAQLLGLSFVRSSYEPDSVPAVSLEKLFWYCFFYIYFFIKEQCE